MHFRGEGKTSFAGGSASTRFYPMHFRGEGKTTTVDIRNVRGILPDALPGGRQNSVTALPPRVSDFTRCTSGGKAKLPLIANMLRRPFYPMHFRGEGKTLSNRGSLADGILPDALPGGRQNTPQPVISTAMILPDALPGGRQNNQYAFWPDATHFTRCTSGGKAKLADARAADG